MSGIFVIEVNLASSEYWVLDSGSCAHICSNLQELKWPRKLAKGEVKLVVGNGMTVYATHVACIELIFSLGLIVELDEVYYVPAITKNIVSISCLDKNGFVCIFGNRVATLNKDGMVYATFKLINGLYLLDLDNNVLSIDNNKRLKTRKYDDTLLWHCRLGHINERCIKELHTNGFLGQFDFESLDTCETCLGGKMTKAPFTKKGERVKELLGLIHTDVCGPINVHAKGGYRYFITFTDDFSRYGYVYLMKSNPNPLKSSNNLRMK